MKKMIALLLALIMVFSLVACSGSADTAKDTTTTDSTTTDTADTNGSDTTAAPQAPRAASSMSAWPPSPTPSTRL